MKYQLPILLKWWQVSHNISKTYIKNVEKSNTKCFDGKVIKNAQICDGNFDCLNFEDEKDCENCPEQVLIRSCRTDSLQRRLFLSYEVFNQKFRCNKLKFDI